MITNGFEIAWLRSLGRHAEAESRIKQAEEFLEAYRNDLVNPRLASGSIHSVSNSPEQKPNSTD